MTMKKVTMMVIMLASTMATTFGQSFMTRTGKISFNATAPSSPEKIEAVNNEVANILDAKSGALVFQVPVKSFKFERELMQEHFNENYMESDKFPRADFKGTITNVADVNFGKDGTYNAKVSGKMTMHGVTKDVNTSGTITVQGNTIKAAAKFSLKLADYGINVPSVVADKVGKEARIALESTLSKK